MFESLTLTQVIEPMEHSSQPLYIRITFPANYTEGLRSLALNTFGLLTLLDGVGKTTPVDEIIVRASNGYINSRVSISLYIIIYDRVFINPPLHPPVRQSV